MEMTDFALGDIVHHNDEAHPRRLAFVTGFTGRDTMLRVQTTDYRHRVWAKRNVYKLDCDLDYFESCFPHDLQLQRRKIIA